MKNTSRENSGLLVLFCGPSGSGKTSIVHRMLDKFPQLCFSVSATTRARRKNEEHGRDYYFISVSEFKKKIQNNEFLEWEEVYENGFYGTLKSEVERIAAKNKVAVFDVDVEGGLSIRKEFGNNLLDIFVMPPSLEELKKRLVARASETDETLMARILRAEMELNYASRFSHVLVNHQLEQTIREAEKLIYDFFLEKNVPVHF